ncbi:MAG TPA: alginate export family protein [Pirellulales bacterium]|nr:alginate export family protein [Pirellulales bacterium]
MTVVCLGTGMAVAQESDTEVNGRPGLPSAPVTFQSATRGNASQRGSDQYAFPAETAAVVPEAQQSLWSQVPVLQPLPRIGWFSIAPSGPGYYSARDFLSGNFRPSAPSVPYPPVASNPIAFFDANYKFLDGVDPADRDFFGRLKRRHPGDDWMWSVGGEERVRYMNQINSRLTSLINRYTLTRSRIYLDVWYTDLFRVYVEMQDSQTTPQSQPPLASDADHADLLNLFADLKLGEYDDSPIYLRGGRQELNYGSQRLISSSDFPNVRRTFSGIKGFWRSENWDLDGFAVEPVEMLVDRFDQPNPRIQFAGIWSNYRPCQGQQIDTYYLFLDDTNQTASGNFGAVGGYDVSTLGARYAGDWENSLWDFEGMYQFGRYVNEQTIAGGSATGLGRRFASLPSTPQFWVYYEWASGNRYPGDPVHRTFNQLYPWGHAYFGYLDLVGRQNIRDLNMQFTCFPTKWITPVVQYHIFRLDSARDALYAANGAVLRYDPTGAAGRDVGDEIDFTVNFHVSEHQDVFVGYSKLFAGSFIKQTGPGGSPEVTYVSYSFKW